MRIVAEDLPLQNPRAPTSAFQDFAPPGAFRDGLIMDNAAARLPEVGAWKLSY